MDKDSLIRVIYHFYDDLKNKIVDVENELDFKNELKKLQDKHCIYSDGTREEVKKLTSRKETLKEISEEFLGQLENYDISIDEIDYEMND